jgi:vomeronasal1 receptor
MFLFEIFLDDIGCKQIMYISQITRDMSLCAMCLLSCFKAITIIPSNSRWMVLTYRATKCSISWLVHLLLNLRIPARVSGLSYKNDVTNRLSYAYCSLFTSSHVRAALYWFLLCSSDGLCLGLVAY